MRISLGLAAAFFSLASTVALAQPAMEADSGVGAILVDEHGMALYTYDRYEPDVSNCYNNCAISWPPLMAAADATPTGDWTIVQRTDGTQMWAYKGEPLYLWIEDLLPGDVNGDGRGDVWHVARP